MEAVFEKYIIWFAIIPNHQNTFHLPLMRSEHSCIWVHIGADTNEEAEHPAVSGKGF